MSYFPLPYADHPARHSANAQRASSSTMQSDDVVSLRRKYDRLKARCLDKDTELEKYKNSYEKLVASSSTSAKEDASRITYLTRKLEDAENAQKEERLSSAAKREKYLAELEAKRKQIKEHEHHITRLTRQLDEAQTDMRTASKAYDKDARELRDLRLQVKALEQERDKLAKRQDDVADLRKALAQTEDRSKASTQDYRKKISELQTSLQNEKDENALLEINIAGLKQRLEQSTRSARSELKSVQKDLLASEAQRQKDKEEQQSEVGEQVDALQEEIESLRNAQNILTKDYAQLLAGTVPRRKYKEVSLKVAELELHASQLERRLSESEDQVACIAVHLRHARSETALLQAELDERDSVVEWYSTSFNPGVAIFDEIRNDSSLYREIDDLLLEESAFRAASAGLAAKSFEMSCTLYRECGWGMVSELIMKNQDFIEEQESKKTAIQELFKVREKVTDLTSENEMHKKQMDDLRNQNVEILCSINELKQKLESSARALIDEQNRGKAEMAKKEDLLKKEREITTRLSATLQKEKIKEEALKAEADQLAMNLAEAEAYREAFYELSEEMKGLIARSVLAEEEAERISKFNAEILGHHNPTQRIYYVDRIRKELAELKQKLVISTQSIATFADENESLRRELSTYKSVSVPIQGKPRTNMTRIQRMPLSSIQSAYADPIPKDDWVDLATDIM